MKTRTDNQVILTWLNDAYAMENAQIKFLEAQVGRETDFPQFRDRCRDHLARTRNQAEVLKGRIEQLGGHPSTVKTTLGKALGYLQTLFTTLADDSLVKTAIVLLASEQFEMGSYKVLRYIAEKAEDHETAKVCDRIVGEEEEMAGWVHEHLPQMALASRYGSK